MEVGRRAGRKNKGKRRRRRERRKMKRGPEARVKGSVG